MLWVDVIGMAMGDKDGIEISKSTPGLTEVTGVDEDSLPSCFNEDAGVSQMRNSHTSVFRQHHAAATSSVTFATGTIPPIGALRGPPDRS